jgi:N utilization substance protein A
VDTNEAEKSAIVVVPDGQLSLAIGKEGQNARLAARLTGWKIDIKSASVAAAERKTLVGKEPPEAVLVEELAKVEEPAKAREPISRVKEEVAVSDVLPLVEKEPELPQKVEEEAEEVVLYEPPPEVEVPAEKPKIRFAEDIFAPKAAKPDIKKKDKKKKSSKEDKLEAGKARKIRKQRLPKDEFEEELEE